jgi:hypothetical protein
MVLEDLLKLYPEEVQSLARDARNAVIEWVPDGSWLQRYGLHAHPK